MRRDLSGKLVLDTSTLIELVFSISIGLKLKEALEMDSLKLYTTELSIAELRYILCRRLGLIQSNKMVNKLFSIWLHYN